MENDQYAKAIQYSLGVSNNAAGLLNLVQDMGQQVQQANNRANAAAMSAEIFYEVFERVKAILNTYGVGPIQYDHFEEALQLPDLSPAPPEELKRRLADWKQEYRFDNPHLFSKEGRECQLKNQSPENVVPITDGQKPT